MRAVFVGASALTVMTAMLLVQRGHEVVVIEQDKAKIDALHDQLDCGYLHGDGSKPGVLREADPQHSGFLFCLTGNDQTNIITALAGRSLGFGRVIAKIDDAEFEHVCLELGLSDVIIPARTIGRHLAEMVEGQDPLEVSAMVKGDARAFLFVVRGADARPLRDLELPKETRVVCIYRDGALLLPEDDTTLERGDEVVLITHLRQFERLVARFGASGGDAPTPDAG